MLRGLVATVRAGRLGFQAREAARRAFQKAYPAEKVKGTRLRAAEKGRIVVAVVIDPAYVYRGVPPQRLFAVSRDLSSCDELPRSEWPAYGLRGSR